MLLPDAIQGVVCSAWSKVQAGSRGPGRSREAGALVFKGAEPTHLFIVAFYTQSGCKEGLERGSREGSGMSSSGSGPRDPIPRLCWAGLCLQDHRGGSMGRGASGCDSSRAAGSRGSEASSTDYGDLLAPGSLLQPGSAALGASLQGVSEAARGKNALVVVM